MHTLVPYASFLRDYRVYAAERGLAVSGAGFHSGLQVFLNVTQPYCIAAGDVPCAGTPGEAQRLVVPATYAPRVSMRPHAPASALASPHSKQT